MSFDLWVCGLDKPTKPSLQCPKTKMMEVGELTSRSVSGGGEGKNDPYGAVAIFPNNCTNQTVQTPN